MRPSVVLVPVDRSTDVSRAVRLAVRVATAPVDVHLVQVVAADHLRPLDDEWRGPVRHSTDADGVAVSLRIAAATRYLSTKRAAIRTVRVHGKADAIIPAYAQLAGASMIIVERDYGSPRAWRSSGVVRRLSRSSPVPVLVLPPAEAGAATADVGAFRRIVAAVDSSVGSTVALRTAADVSRRHDASLTLLHAMDAVPWPALLSNVEEPRPRTRMRQIAAQLKRRAALVGAVNAESQVVAGEPGRAIAEASADLIVMGVAPRAWLDQKVFGSTLSTVLRRAKSPVLVVPVVGGAQPWYGETTAEEPVRTLDRFAFPVRVAK